MPDRLQQLEYSNSPGLMFFHWVIRGEFTCLPRAYDVSADYCSTGMKERHFYTKAYNHHCGNWGSLLKLLNSLTESAVVLGDALEKIATASMGIALKHAFLLCDMLLHRNTKVVGPFNVNEILWWATLLREGFDFLAGRPAKMVVPRTKSSLGPNSDGTRLTSQNFEISQLSLSHFHSLSLSLSLYWAKSCSSLRPIAAVSLPARPPVHKLNGCWDTFYKISMVVHGFLGVDPPTVPRVSKFNVHAYGI